MKYCYDISIKFWISFDESKWNFDKNVHKNVIRIMKSFLKNIKRFRAYFAEIKFRIGKILRKFYANVEILVWLLKIFGLNLKNHEEVLKKCKDFLRARKFVKWPGKFQKVLKILREAFKKILKKRKVNLAENRWSKK